MRDVLRVQVRVRGMPRKSSIGLTWLQPVPLRFAALFNFARLASIRDSGLLIPRSLVRVQHAQPSELELAAVPHVGASTRVVEPL